MVAIGPLAVCVGSSAGRAVVICFVGMVANLGIGLFHDLIKGWFVFALVVTVKGGRGCIRRAKRIALYAEGCRVGVADTVITRIYQIIAYCLLTIHFIHQCYRCAGMTFITIEGRG